MLYGIPISIKENYEMRGFDCTYGCGALCNRPYHSDGYIVRLLRSEGAIPFVRSNIPQFSFAMECYNELYGRGLNPWNKSRTPGGSSGGEAGLIAARCSPIGLGSDMGGSIRGPAGFCGIVGFKPSGTRVSSKGHSIMSEAFNGIAQIIKNCPGPLCKSVDDVNLMMKCFLNEKFFKENRDKEPDIHHFFVPWNEELTKSKQRMKIGYIKNDEFMPVTPSFIRAIEEACEILKKNGHELVEINIPFLNEIQGMYYQILSMEGDLLLF